MRRDSDSDLLRVRPPRAATGDATADARRGIADRIGWKRAESERRAGVHVEPASQPTCSRAVRRESSPSTYSEGRWPRPPRPCGHRQQGRPKTCVPVDGGAVHRREEHSTYNTRDDLIGTWATRTRAPLGQAARAVMHQKRGARERRVWSTFREQRAAQKVHDSKCSQWQRGHLVRRSSPHVDEVPILSTRTQHIKITSGISSMRSCARPDDKARAHSECVLRLSGTAPEHTCHRGC
jgi:hypothetical protein